MKLVENIMFGGIKIILVSFLLSLLVLTGLKISSVAKVSADNTETNLFIEKQWRQDTTTL